MLGVPLKPLLCLYFLLIGLVKSETDWEALFLKQLSPNNLRRNLKKLTSYPHVILAKDKAYNDVQWYFRQYGLTEILNAGFSAKVDIAFNLHLELISPFNFNASLSEEIYASDPLTDTIYRNDTFLAYGSGELVTNATLVYANYGREEDFEYLTSQGVNISDAVVIVRHGHISAGAKVMLAQKFGASGCLIYSDPIDDGFVKGAVYDEGPWRARSGIQRDTLLFSSLCPGNPYFGDSRDDDVCGGYKTKDLIPQIPVLPLSWGDAEPLLRVLSQQGVAAPAAWQGGFNFTYNIGVGPARVSVSTLEARGSFNFHQFCSSFKGNHPDPEIANQEIIFGNHHDAWIYGAADPGSGTAVMLEVIKAFHELIKQGWKPIRTLKFCSWDASEFGLLGSVHYGERYRDYLTENTIAYINVDTAVAGHNWKIGVSPSLQELAMDLMKDVLSPTNESIYDVWGKHFKVLGADSDYTVFLQHLGIASADFGWRGMDGQHHSLYDSFHWMSTFIDPTFEYHKSAAQFLGSFGLQLASSKVLPFNYMNYSQALDRYYQVIVDLAKQYNIEPDFSPMAKALDRFAKAAQWIEDYRRSLANSSSSSSKDIDDLNTRLFRAERYFLTKEGVPERPWYKHAVQAPGLHDGHNAEVFAGIQQAIKAKNVMLAKEQIELTAKAIERVADYLHPDSSKESSNGGGSNVGLVVGLAIAAVVLVVVVYFGYKKYQANRRDREPLLQAPYHNV